MKFKNETGSVFIYVLVIFAIFLITTPVIIGGVISKDKTVNNIEDQKLVQLFAVSSMEAYLKELYNNEDKIESFDGLNNLKLNFPGEDGEVQKVILPDQRVLSYHFTKTKNDERYEIEIVASIGDVSKELSYEIIKSDPNIDDLVNDLYGGNLEGNGSGGGVLKQPTIWFESISDYDEVILDYNLNNVSKLPVTLCESGCPNGKIKQGIGNEIVQTFEYRFTIYLKDGSQFETPWTSPFGIEFKNPYEALVWFTAYADISSVEFPKVPKGANMEDFILNEITHRYEATLQSDVPMENLEYQFWFDVEVTKKNGIQTKQVHSQKVVTPVYGVDQISNDKVRVWFYPEENTTYEDLVVNYIANDDMGSVVMTPDNGLYVAEIEADNIDMLQYRISYKKNGEQEEHNTVWNTYRFNSLWDTERD